VYLGSSEWSIVSELVFWWRYEAEVGVDDLCCVLS
jgi:hypothetical protein